MAWRVDETAAPVRGSISMHTELRNRWWVVLASVFGLLVGNGPVMQFTFGTMLPEVSRAFG